MRNEAPAAGGAAAVGTGFAVRNAAGTVKGFAGGEFSAKGFVGGRFVDEGFAGTKYVTPKLLTGETSVSGGFARINCAERSVVRDVYIPALGGFALRRTPDSVEYTSMT